MATSAFSMFRGDVFPLDVTLTDPSQNNAAINLSGKTLTFTAKLAATDEDVNAKIRLTAADGGIEITDSVMGKATIWILPRHTEVFTAQTTLLWDLQLKVSDTRVYTPASGTLTINPDITKMRV